MKCTTILAVILMASVCLAGDAPQSTAARNAMTRYTVAKGKLDAEYDARLQAMERALVAELRVAMTAATKAGNLDEANAIKGEIDKLDQQSITIKALIDGESELHLAPEGMYWVQGAAAKPGRHGNRNEPTLINGFRWAPAWRSDSDRGPDRSEVVAIKLAKSYVIESVTADGKPAAALVGLKQIGNEQVISIPDKEGGSRVYAITLSPAR